MFVTFQTSAFPFFPNTLSPVRHATVPVAMTCCCPTSTCGIRESAKNTKNTNKHKTQTNNKHKNTQMIIYSSYSFETHKTQNHKNTPNALLYFPVHTTGCDGSVGFNLARNVTERLHGHAAMHCAETGCW